MWVRVGVQGKDMGEAAFKSLAAYQHQNLLRKADQMSEEDLNLILTVAQATLGVIRGPLSKQLGSSAEAHLGDKTIFADGTGRVIRASIVAKQEFAGYWEYLLEEAIFTAPSHPQWGGSPLIGANGELLGIGSLQLQQSGDGGVGR